MELDKYSLLRGTRTVLQTVVEPIDWAACRLNNKEGYPPLRLRQHVGDLRDFEGSGGEYIAYLKLLCGLKPEDWLMDIGCGCGLVNLKLTGPSNLVEYLGSSGLYVGMDIHRTSIKWAKKNFGGRCKFELMDISPKGYFSPSNYVFPWSKDQFNIVLAKSLFTHMWHTEVENYLKEIYRILVPGGCCLATFFLMEEHAWERAFYDFRYEDGRTYYMRKDRPKLGTAFKEEAIIALVGNVGLKVELIKRGTWSGRQGGLSFQDIMILRKEK